MDTLRKVSPLVLVKDGQGPPIVIAHGLSGLVQVAQLAKHIRTPHPIYGIQAKGVDGVDEPFGTVEEMADFYVEALEEISTNGLYLMGYSFGGLVALEMAQRLRANGKKVFLLAMLDAYPHPQFLRPTIRISLYAQRLKNHLQNMWHMPLPKAFDYFWAGFRRRFHLAKGQESASSESDSEPSLSPITDPRVRRVKQEAYKAYAQYQPRFYPGKVSFVTTETKTFFPKDPAAVWRPLVQDFEVEVVKGDHLNIVTTEFQSLASVLTSFVERAEDQIETDVRVLL